MKKEKKIKIVEAVSRQRLKCLIYSSYMLGFMACSEGRSLDNPDNFVEIKNVIALSSKDHYNSR